MAPKPERRLVQSIGKAVYEEGGVRVTFLKRGKTVIEVRDEQGVYRRYNPFAAMNRAARAARDYLR